jgi:hypothetical protein
LKCHRDRNAFTWARSKNNRKTHLKKQNFMFNKKQPFSHSFIPSTHTHDDPSLWSTRKIKFV